MDRRAGLMVAAVGLAVLLAVVWWGRPEPATPPTVVPTPVAPRAGPPRLQARPPAPSIAEDPALLDALDVVAEVQGALRLTCPDPGVPLGPTPFLWVVPRDGSLEVLVAEPTGQGLAYPDPLRGGVPTGLAGPVARVAWDVDAGRCDWHDVEYVPVRGVVEDEQGPVPGTWVVGCGAPMHPVDPDGRFEVDVPVGAPCRLQAEGRGEGVFVDPEAPDEVVVPWVPRKGTEREAVAARIREQLDALDALAAQTDPWTVVLDDPSTDPAVREVLEQWASQEAAKEAGRRRWLEQVLRRYEGPPPEPFRVDPDDAPDVWNLDALTR